MAFSEHFSPVEGWQDHDILSKEDWDSRIFNLKPFPCWSKEFTDLSPPLIHRVECQVRGNKVDFMVHMGRPDATPVPGAEEVFPDIRVYSDRLASMRQAAFKLAGIEDDGPALEQHLYPIDTAANYESFDLPPVLTKHQADFLLNFIMTSTEERVPVLAMAQQVCIRMRRNVEQFRRLRRFIISLCLAEDFLSDIGDANPLSYIGHGMLLRLMAEEPRDWVVCSSAAETDFDSLAAHTIPQELRTVWCSLSAAALRPANERIDAVDVAVTLDHELPRLAKLGLKRFYEKILKRPVDVETSTVKTMIPPLTSHEDALRCAVCLTGFNQLNPPITFFDGTSACRKCVDKKRKQLSQTIQKFNLQQGVDADDTARPNLADVFGSSVDLTLQRVIEVLYGKRAKTDSTSASRAEEEKEMKEEEDVERAFMVGRGAAAARYAMGDYTMGLLFNCRVLMDDPSNATAHSNRAAILFKRGHVEAAYKDALCAVRFSQGRWGKAHFRVFQVFPHLWKTQGAIRREASFIANANGTEISEEEYVRQVMDRQSYQLGKERYEGWLKDPVRAVEAMASLTRAFALGENVEQQFIKSMRSFLLADCSRFDDLVNSSPCEVSVAEFNQRLAELRKASLMMNLCRELLTCERLFETMSTDTSSAASDQTIAELEEWARKEGPQLSRPLRATPLLSSDAMREALRAAESDLDCTLCYSLMSDPATMPCGHSFCRSCALRAIEHSAHTDEAKCPVCRASFDDFMEALHAMGPLSTTYPPITLPLEHIRPNRALDAIIQFGFPEESAKRHAQIEAEEAVLLPGMIAPDEQDNMVMCVPLMWIPRVPDPANVVQSLELSDPAERLMMRRIAVEILRHRADAERNKTRTGQEESSVGRCGLHFARTADETPRFGVLVDVDEIGLAVETLNTIVFCKGFARFEVQLVESRDGYKVARVRLFEQSFKDHAVDTTVWKAQFSSTKDMTAAIADARATLFRTAPDALLQVAAELYYAKVKKQNQQPEDDLALEEEHPGGLPYYIAYKLHFSNTLLYYLMFSDATRNSFRERLRLVLIVGNPEGISRGWDIEAADLLEFPGLSELLVH